MEYKRMDGTKQRPLGDRVIDAPFVFMDVDTYARMLKEEEAWEKYDRNGITLFKSDHLSMVLVCLREKAVITNEAVAGYITIELRKGRVRVKTVDGDIDLEANQVMAFHPFIDHYIEALEESTVLLTNNTALG